MLIDLILLIEISQILFQQTVNLMPRLIHRNETKLMYRYFILKSIFIHI